MIASSPAQTERALQSDILVALYVGAAALLTFALGIAWFVYPRAPWSVLMPAVATLVVFAVFFERLHRRVGSGAFGEIGLVYVCFIVAYTLLPALTFATVDLEVAQGWVWDNLSLLLPETAELGTHLWRHVLFLAGVCVGYLAFRGADSTPELQPLRPQNDHLAVAYLAVAIVLAIASVTLASAPVLSYHDHYIRFDHLSWGALRLMYVLLILKTSGYFLLLTLFFRNYQKYRVVILPTIIAIAAYETTYSLGARIETLAIVLGAVCLYHHNVRPISIQRGIAVFLGIAALFTVVEVVRAMEFDIAAAREAAASEGAGPASEFGAVFFTSFHLYGERARGTLPERDWLMFFSDLLAFVPFIERTEWSPQYWYARHYYPDVVVPPQTNGPIADSALWGGEWDLLLRGVFSGAVYAWLMRWFMRHRHRWWAMVVYAYCFATCVMTLKYSVLYPLTPLVRILLPGMLALWLSTRLLGRVRL